MVTNMKDWVVHSRATRHICGNKSAFTSYTTVKEGEEQVFLGDSRSTPCLPLVMFFMCQISAGTWCQYLFLVK
ncbi:hypothetical protein AAG906_029154 [Vitis piasezkii]